MKAVVFDFGAVLFQWHPLALLQQTVPELAPDEAGARRVAAQVFESFTPDSDWARFDLGLVAEDELAQRIATRMGAQAQQVRRIIDAIPPHLQPQEPSVALFRQLKAAGHRMYFLSNMPVPYARHLQRHNNFIAEFADGIFSGDVGLVKPHAEIFALAESRFDLDPARTLFIDDHAGNIEAARARGWQGVRFESAEQVERDAGEAGWLPQAG